jgi:hypothetical protein
VSSRNIAVSLTANDTKCTRLSYVFYQLQGMTSKEKRSPRSSLASNVLHVGLSTIPSGLSTAGIIANHNQSFLLSHETELKEASFDFDLCLCLTCLLADAKSKYERGYDGILNIMWLVRGNRIQSVKYNDTNPERPTTP